MNRRYAALLCTAALWLGLCGCGDAFGVSQKAAARPPLTEYESLGIPAAKYYDENLVARCALDMELYGGRLYVGCGDYDKNTAPTPVLSCDLDYLGEWQEETTLQEEQVGRFVTLNGRLTIPGFDPDGRPETARYYQRTDKGWKAVSGLPHGLHNFDLARYKGGIFAALGAPAGKSPVAVSWDNGKSFRMVRMVRDGKELPFDNCEFSRCYNLYELNGHLYADLRYGDETTKKMVYDVYRYEKGAFVYVGDLNRKMDGGLYGITTPPLWEKAEIRDTLYLTTGYLYTTKDMKTFDEVVLTKGAVTYDLYRYGGRLYILTATKRKDGKYTVEIYSIANPKRGNYHKEATFTYPVIPTALAVNKDAFFLSMGDWAADAKQNGTVLYMKR